MESTRTHTETIETKPTRSPAVSALAIVGFIALILIGMGLAIYAARFMPAAISGLGEAAVSLSNVFTPDNDADIEVVSDQPATPRELGTVVTIPIVDSTPTTPAATPTHTPPATGGPQYQPAPIYSAPVIIPTTPNYSGLPDLTLEIVAIGYLNRSGDTNSFVAASRVPSDKEGAVKFRIKNQGTNVSGKFEYEVRVENADNKTDTASRTSASLPPNQAVTSFARFDANKSGDVEITLEVDSGEDVRESNERNNSDSEEITARN
ncbi:MAG: CARDB domain-containing protein [Patescibacteria group bacterium]